MEMFSNKKGGCCLVGKQSSVFGDFMEQSDNTGGFSATLNFAIIPYKKNKFCSSVLSSEK